MTYYCNIDHMQNDVEHRQLCSALQQVAAADVSGKVLNSYAPPPNVVINLQNNILPFFQGVTFLPNAPT